MTALCLSASSAMAAIVDGVRQRPTAASMNTMPAQEEVSYLYNVSAHQFFCGDNDWSTRASVSPKGYKVKLVDSMGDGTVEIVDSVETQSTWKSTFSTADAGAIWVDNSSEAYRFWTFVEVDGRAGTYRIGNAVAEGKYLGWNGNEGDTRLYFIEAADEGSCWQFVGEEAYQAYQTEWAAMKDQYEKAAELKTYLDAAKAEGIDTGTWTAVYLNEAATVEELDAALVAVQKAINDKAAGGATVANPSDMTASILNPTFENASYEGWKGTQPNMTGSGAHGPANVAEHYNKTFDTYQDLNNMPRGVYALSANAVFRGSWDDHVNHTNYVAYLYARSDGDTLTAEIPNPWDAMNTEPMAGSTPWGVAAAEESLQVDGVTYYIPNDPSAGRLYFEKGYYLKQVFFAHDGDEAVRVGVMKNKKVTDTDWVMFDNFRLTYYGDAAEAYQFWLDEMKKDATDYSGATASKQYKDAYQEAFNAKVTNKQEALAAMKAVQAAAEAISQNVALWKQLADEMTRAMGYVANSEYEDLEATWKLGDYLDEVNEAMVNVSDDKRTASNEALQEAIDTLAEMIEAVREEAKNAMKPGDDVTSYMTNPDFSNGTTGWTVESNGGGNVQSTAGTFEAWHSTNFDVYQEVKGLPVGVYEISVQGYVRYLDGQEAINAKESVPRDIPIYVYMNDSKTKFANWFDYPQEAGFFGGVSGAAWLSDADGNEYPDNTTAAAAAFSKGDYTRSAFGLVAKKGDVLRVGVKGNPSEAKFWPCFDNFKLTYRGYAAEVVKPILEQRMTEANSYTGTMTTLSANAALTEAVAQGTAALAGDDGKVMFDALWTLTKAFSLVEEGNALCKQLNNAVEELLAVASESESAKVPEAQALAKEITAKLDSSSLDNLDIDSYLEQVAKLVFELQLPDDYLNATDEAPANVTAFIKTPGFSKVVDGTETNSIDGWTATGHKFGNSDQLSALALESWESVLDIYQDITGLPSGIYVLKVNAWQRTSNPTYLYAETSSQHFSKELITQEAGLPEGFSAPSSLLEATAMFDEQTYMNELVVKVDDGSLRIGIKKEQSSDADWVVMDNFQLIYHGTNSSLQVDDDPMGINTVVGSTVVKTEYFMLDGRKGSVSRKGVVIKKTTLSDGSVVTVKQLVRR